MIRIACGVEYDGTNFRGWQSQESVRTVQDCLEHGFSKVAAEPIRVVCAGRTDSGVHAAGQVIHFDTAAQRSMRAWTLGTNVNIPRDVAVLWARPVDRQFHARFSARSRWYQYRILNRMVRPALGRHQYTWFHGSLDIERMNAAACCLLGEHDFSSFRALACQAKTPIRTIYQLSIARHGDEVVIDVRANAFLHHMVRNIVGVLMAIGQGVQEPNWAAEVLAQRDRRLGGVTAPAAGLTLLKVYYPEPYTFP